MNQSYNLPDMIGRFWFQSSVPPSYLPVLLLLLGTFVISLVFFRRFLDGSMGRAFLLWLIALAAAVLFLPARVPLWGFWAGHLTGPVIWPELFFSAPTYSSAPGFEFLLFFLLLMLSIGLGLKLWQKWVGGDLTEREKLPNMEGLRAWLSAGNVLCALGISVTAFLLFRYSFMGLFLVLLLLLAAYPLLNIGSQPAIGGGESGERDEDLSVEREKVLQMLEEGKITAEESAELLNALGQTVSRRRATWPPESPFRQITLIGAGLVLLAYLLPFDGRAIPGDPRFALVVLLGIGAALLPYAVARSESGALRSVIWVCLGVGAILLLSLFAEGLRALSFGLLLAVAGYALVFLGTMRERMGARG